MALIHWWPLNGDTKDYGLDPVALTNSGATVNAAGKIGKCYFLSYSAGFTGKFNTNALMSGECSFSLWIKIPDAEYRARVNSFSYDSSHVLMNSRIFGTSGSYAKTGLCLALQTNNIYNDGSFTGTNLCMGWRDSNSAPVWGGTGVTLDTWYHIAITKASDRKMCMYVNGTKVVGPSTASTGTFPESNFYINTSGVWGSGNYRNSNAPMYINDFRIYDHALTPKEVKDISKGLVLHYDFEDEEIEPTINLGNTSATYSNQTEGTAYGATAWGGDAGTITYYKSGGYNNYPYKVYHKTAKGTGGIYRKTADDIVIEAGKTYTMSIYIKASTDIDNASAYSFNINRGSDNNYINYGASFNITTEWKRLVKTFTATKSQAGSYGEMSIIYDDTTTDYYVYYSGFQIEEKDHVTPYINGTRNNCTVYDNSGYGYNGTAYGGLSISKATAIGKSASKFDGSSAYIETNFPGNLDIYSFALWVKFATSDAAHVIDFRNSGASSGCQPFYGGLGYGIQFYSTNGGSLQPSVAMCGWSSSNINEWQHVVGIITTTGCKLYVNGQLKGSNTTTKTNPTEWGTLPLRLGTRCSGANWFNGEIADFKIYATELSDTDVLKEYQSMANIDKSYNLTARLFVENPTKTDFAKLDQQGVFTAKALDESAFATALNFKTYDNGDLVAREFKEC